MTVSVADLAQESIHGGGGFFKPRVAWAQVATGHAEIHVSDPIEGELHVPRDFEHISGDRATEAVYRAIRKMPGAGAALRLRRGGELDFGSTDV